MDDKHQQIQFERVRNLYFGGRRILLGGSIFILFITLFIKDHLPLPLVFAWAASAILSLTPRLLLSSYFIKKFNGGEIEAHEASKWERRWIYSILLTSLVLSAPVFFPLEKEQLLTVALCVMALSAGNLISSSISLKVMAMSGGIIFIAIAIRFYMLGYVDLGSFYIACLAIFANYAYSLNRTITENIQLRLEKEELSITDPLTNLHNRRGLDLFIEKLIPRSLRSKENFGIIVLDIDGFKQHNDTFGHSEGDKLLNLVVASIEKEIREGDIAVRYGGDEILAVCPATGSEELIEISHRIFDRIRKTTDITVSAGLAVFSPELDFEQLVQLADQALYQAKAEGKDKYVLAQ